MKKTAKILCALLTIATLVCFVQLPASAAKNVCVNVSGSAANCNKWTTITVKTGKNWLSNKIVFTQTKGELHYGANLFTESVYGAYTIKVTDEDTDTTKEYYWKYKKDYTLKLKDNTTYTIKIKPYQPATIGDQKLKNSKSSFLDVRLGVYNKFNWSWSTPSKWNVKSTRAVDFCK